MHDRRSMGEGSFAADVPTRRLIDTAGLVCTLGYATLAFHARQVGEPDLLAFFGIVVWTAVPVFGLYGYFRRRDEPFPVGRLIFWAVVFRLCGLIGGPIYEDDFYRYLWDGYRFATAGTPYGVAPEEFFVDPGVPLALQAALDGINYPELPTIYGPTTELLFLLGYWLRPGSLVALQSLLIAVDLATLALLLRLAPARNVLLYAWCPLVVKEIAFTAHPDGLGVCLLLAAIVLAGRQYWRGAAVCLGFAVGAKVFALALVPLVLIGAKVRHWLWFGATLALLYGPFVLTGATDFDSLVVFAREWEFNSAAFGLATLVLTATQAKFALAAVCGGFLVWYWRRLGDTGGVPRGDWVYGLLLVAAPVINPWYALWLLPFAVVFPSAWAWTASIAVFMAYITGLNLNSYDLQPYGQPVWARPLEFGAILAVFAWELFRRNPKFPERT